METKMWAIDELRRNRIKVDRNVVYLPRVGPGIKMWRWIDCLTSHYKFIRIREETHGRVRK